MRYPNYSSIHPIPRTHKKKQRHCRSSQKRRRKKHIEEESQLKTSDHIQDLKSAFPQCIRHSDRRRVKEIEGKTIEPESEKGEKKERKNRMNMKDQKHLQKTWIFLVFSPALLGRGLLVALLAELSEQRLGLAGTAVG